MSDHEEVLDTGYQTPIPELDDHRHQTPAAQVQRDDRPRRGTFDSLYGARGRLDSDTSRNEQAGLSSTRVRDFEHAVVDDEDAGEFSPTARRQRRPTVDTTTSSRDPSPPNSVKAFALARRREAAMSFSEPKLDKDKKADDHGHELQRAMSIVSRQSHRSRPHTVKDSDVASLRTNKSDAEEDVCFPQDDRENTALSIDFEYIEDFIRSQNELRANRHPAEGKVFPDLRPQSAVPEDGPTQVMTNDGDILEMPSESSFEDEKKKKHDDAPYVAKDVSQHDPNRFSFFSSAWESTIHAPELADLVLPDEDIRSLFAFPREETDGVWWLNVNRPTEDEVRAICKSFGIHPLTIEDITTREAREKIELFKAYYFANFRSFSAVTDENGDPEFEPFNMFVIVFREGILSFSHTPNSHASEVRKRITKLKDYVSLSSDWICYALIDNIVDSFGPVIHKIELEADAIEDEVFIARTDDTSTFLRRIGILRKNVMALMRLLGGKADVLKGFTKRCNENYQVTPRMDIGLYLGDIQDHVVTMMTNMSHFEKILSRSHSNYLAQLSIDSITQGTRANKVLSKITFLASIIVPLNVITGLFGMNVKVPWADDANLHAFFGIMGCLILFSVVSIVMARKFRYI